MKNTMMQRVHRQRSTQIALITALTMAIILPSMLADESNKKLDTPGYRPDSKQAGAFLRSHQSSEIIVFPAVMRTRKGTSNLPAVQKEIVRFLTDKQLGRARPANTTINLGKAQGRFQWDLFQNGMKAFATQLKTTKPAADYSLLLEFLVTPTPRQGLAVGGIHCYILDAKGRNAFSFLLNSHHRLFVAAKLNASDASEQSRHRLIAKGTQVALQALVSQLHAQPDQK